MTQDLIARIATATNLTTAEVTAWVNADEAYNVDAIDAQMRDALGEAEEHPLVTLNARGIITDEECAELAE